MGQTYCSYSLDKEKMQEASALLGQIVKTLENFSEKFVYILLKKSSTELFLMHNLIIYIFNIH